MAIRNNIDRLNQVPARSGRMILEDGSEINGANSSLSSIYQSASAMAAAGRAFFTSETLTIPALGSVIYTLVTPPGKYVIQYARDLKVTGNVWDIETILNGTVTGGTPLDINNAVIDSANVNETQFLSGTSVVGGVVGATDFIAASGQNKAGGLSASAGGTIVVYPPASDFSLRLTNTGNDAQRVHIDYVFSEITPEELETLRGIYVE